MTDDMKEEDSRPTEVDDEPRLPLARKVKFQKRVILMLGVLWIATASFVGGDYLDPLDLNLNPPAYSYELPRSSIASANIAEHDAVTQAQAANGDDTDAPLRTCEDEIRNDLAPEAATIRYLEDANERMPNFHAEYYLATTPRRSLTYTCTITIIPYEVHVAQTGSTLLGGSSAPSQQSNQPGAALKR